MEDLMQNRIKSRWFSGEQIPAGELNNGGLKFFGDTIYHEWTRDRATAQEGLDGELYWQKVLRPNVECVIPQTSDEQQIAAIQAELKLYE